MYTVGVQTELDAYHYLIGGDWGAENQTHPHHYRIELQLEGAVLDAHQYLVDIVEIEGHLDRMVRQFRGKTLNDLPSFAGYNPSIERLARVLCDGLVEALPSANLDAVVVKVWESDSAWAAYRKEL